MGNKINLVEVRCEDVDCMVHSRIVNTVMKLRVSYKEEFDYLSEY
jgi:hypothetical protein